MNIGTLTIEMAANVARLQQDLQAARGSVDSTFQSIGSSVAKLKMLVGTVFAGIAVGSLLEAVDKVKTAAVDIERIAAASGASLDEFQRAAAGAKTVGVNLEKFGDIMKDTQDKLGDFLITGGGELKDFFETIGPKVGVTAESFRNLSGPQALQLFYSSLEKANVGQKVMIQQMESIANDASMLAPLLANGGAEFKSLGEEAAKAGALMSSELIYASKALGEEMMRMDTVTVGISNTIMAELIPAITEMAAASREELSAGFEAVSAWVQDNKEQLLGAWELTKSIGAEVWSIVKVAIELAVGIGKWAVESGFLEASLITIGLLVAGFKDGVDIVGAAFAKLGSIILNAVAKPMSGFLNDVGVVLKWAGQGDLAGVFLDAAEGIKTAGEAGAQYAAGVADKFAAGDTAVARFTAGLGASTQAAQTAAKSTYTAYQALGTGAGISAKATEEAKKSADKAAAAAQKLAEEGVKLAASLLAQDSGLSGDFAAKWDKLNAAYKAGAVSLADLTQAQKLLLAEQPAMKAAADAQTKALEEQAQAWADVRSHMLAYGHAQEQAAQSVVDGNKGLREEITLIGLSSKQQTEVLRQRNQALILTKQHTLAEMERQAAITGTMTREQIALASEIEGLQERNELLGAQEARESWTGFWESVNSTAHDTFVDVANNGMSAFKRIGKTLKSAVLDMLYQMTIKKWIVSIGASVGGGAAMAAQAATGGSGAMGMAGNAASLFGAGASAFGVGASYGTASLFANGLTGTLAAGGQMIGAGSVMSGIGTIAGALGPIALGVAAVMAIVKSLDDSGTMHTGALSQYSAAGGVANSTTHGAFGMGFGGVDYSAETEKFTGAIAQSIVQMLDSTAATFGKEAGYKAATAFADDTSKDGAWGGLLISKLEETIVNWDPTRTSKWAPREFADGAAGKEQYLAAVATDVRAALESIGLPAWATGMLDKLGQGASLEQLAGAVDQINAAKAAFAGFAQYMPTFAGMADSALAALVTASGGVAALAGNMAVFVDGFYTDAEKLAVNTENVRAALAAAGFEMPKTRDEFRALLEQQLALGDSGAKGAAALLSVNAAFASVTPSLEDAAAAAAAISQAALDAAAAQKQLLAQYRPMDVAGATKQIADAGVTINVPNLLALGSQGIRDAMADYISTLTDTTDAGVQQMIATLGNLTPAFGVLISAAETAEAAVTATASATAALASTNLRIQDQIDLLTGKETERSLAIRDAVDDSTKALLGTLYDLKDAADIAPVVDSAASSLENLGNTLERFGESLSLRLDFAKFGGGANPFLSAAGELQAAPNLTLSGGAVPVQNANDGGQFVQLSQWLKNEVAAVNSYVDQQQAAIAAWPDDRGAQFFDANAAASMLPYAAKAFELGASTFKAYFASLGGFALDLEKQLATANNTAIGSALNLVSISKYFSDLATEMADIQTELGKIAAMAVGGLTLDAATSGFANLIGGAATSVSAAITASILDKVPDAIKNDPKLAGVSTSILSVLGAVKKDDVQGLNDGFLLLSGSLTRGELSAAQYEAAIGYLTGAFKGAAEAITEEANKLQAVIDALAGVNRDIARFGMTSFETALLEIQDRADEAATAFGSMAPEIVALAVAERELLNLRNATTAKTTLDGLALDVSRLNMSPLEKELAGITDRADEYVRGLRDIGQATQENIASVGAWEQAMLAHAESAASEGLNNRILALTDAEGYLAQMRENELSLLSPANQLLQERIWALEEEARIAQERTGLQDQLNALTLTSVDLRALEIAKLDEANRPLQERIWLLEEEKRVAEERNGLMSSLYQVLGNTGALRAEQLAKLDPANQALQQQIWQIEDAKTALEKALQAESESANAAQQAAQERVSTLQSIFDALKSNVDSLYESVEATKEWGAAQANAFIDNALANAKATGYMPELDDLNDAMAGARGGLDKQYASEFDRQRETLILAGKLSELQDISGGQLTAAQRQLKAAEAQVEALDGLQAQGRAMLDSLSGNVAATLSVRDAIAGLSAAILATQATKAAAQAVVPAAELPSTWTSGADSWNAGGANFQTSSGFSMGFASGLSKAEIGSVLQSNINVARDLYESGWSQDKGAYGQVADITAWAQENEIPGFAAGGLHMGGLRIVGENGPELEATGPARIWNAQQLGGALGSGNTARLEALVEGLTKKLEGVQAELKGIRESTKNMAENIEEVTEGGNAMRSRSVGVAA